VAEVSVRFCIGDGATRRAATWKCWAIVGNGKNDVYLANRHLAGALKSSLHESGRWHVGFDSKYLANHGDPNDWSSRFIHQWQKPPELAPGFTLAYRIITFSGAVNTTPTQDEIASLVWVSPPPDGRVTEVDVIITAASTRTSTWPGQRSMNTSLVGKFPLDCGDTVWLVSHVVDMPQTAALNVVRERYFGGHTRNDVSGDALRAILFGSEPDGSRTMFDVVMKPEPPTGTKAPPDGSGR